MYWNGVLQTSAAINANQVNALITPDLLAVPGSASVTVVNPGGVRFECRHVHHRRVQLWALAHQRRARRRVQRQHGRGDGFPRHVRMDSIQPRCLDRGHRRSVGRRQWLRHLQRAGQRQQRTALGGGDYRGSVVHSHSGRARLPVRTRSGPHSSGPSGGPFSVTVGLSGADCSWTAGSAPSWVTITQGNGAPGGALNFTVANNPSSLSRTGSITLTTAISQTTLNITESGVACSFTLPQASQAFTSAANPDRLQFPLPQDAPGTPMLPERRLSRSRPAPTDRATAR